MSTTTKASATATDMVEQLMASAFPAARSPRSVEYIAGAQEALQFLLLESPLRCMYAEGSASFDAFQAGTLEGRDIWGRHMEAQLQPVRQQPANAADLLAAELLHAEKIILSMLPMLSSQQKGVLGEKLDRQGVIGDGGITRYHERRAALVAAGYASPETSTGGRPCVHAFQPAT
jgi:hypothetical protein